MDGIYCSGDEVEVLDDAVKEVNSLDEFVEEQDAQVDGPQSQNNDGKATDLKVV